MVCGRTLRGEPRVGCSWSLEHGQQGGKVTVAPRQRTKRKMHERGPAFALL